MIALANLGDFFEEDEPVEDVMGAFDSGDPVHTAAPGFWGPFTVTTSENLTLYPR